MSTTQQQKGLPGNAPAPVGTSPTGGPTLVDKHNETNRTQEPKVLPVNAPAPVGTHLTVSTGLNVVVSGNQPSGSNEGAGGNNVSVGKGSGRRSSSRRAKAHGSKLGAAFKTIKTICHEELESGFGIIKGWITGFEKSSGSKGRDSDSDSDSDSD